MPNLHGKCRTLNVDTINADSVELGGGQRGGGKESGRVGGGQRGGGKERDVQKFLRRASSSGWQAKSALFT